MSISVERADVDATEWNGFVSRAPDASVFHRAEPLRLLESHTGTTLHPLVGYKGQEPIGVLPVFERTVGPITMAVSPPEGFEVFSLGPVLTDPGQLKQRKVERRNRALVEGCLEWIDDELSPEITHIRSTDRHSDLRPFQAHGFDVTPYYTYVVDLDRSEEDLLASFSSDARSNARADDAGYTIEVGDAEACTAIVRQVSDRLDELDKGYPLTPEVGAKLYRRLPDGAVRPYVCLHDGECLGGIIALEHGDTVYRWQGGAKTTVDFPVNDALDWRVMRDARERGVERYDLVGANLARTAQYKSKFGPDPRPYYGARKQAPGMDLLATLRQRLPIVG